MNQEINIPQLRMVFWETTSDCNLKCRHCRGESPLINGLGGMPTEQSLALIDQIAAFANPVLVLSGGEPLVRSDIFDIASYATSKGLRTALATNATMLDEPTARRLVECGISRISISLDGADAPTHDLFRGINGAFDQAVAGMRAAVAAGLDFQINTSVNTHNINQLDDILALAVREKACALHLFMLVPTGCGKELAEDERIGADKYEEVLEWIRARSDDSPIQVRPTCAPHYFRVTKGKPSAHPGGGHPGALNAMSRGCLAGVNVCFVSSQGDVYPCGYFPVSSGNVNDTPLERIWAESEVFRNLRDYSLLKGKCGICRFKNVCGGCRARAYAETGDYLAQEPCCSYDPEK